MTAIKKQMSMIAVIVTFIILITSMMPAMIAEGSDHPNVAFTGTDTEWEALREQAKNRQRNVIYDNDGDDAAAFPNGTEPSIGNILALRTSFLNQYPVDTITYSVTRSGFDHLVTRTKDGEPTEAGSPAYAGAASYQNLTQWLHQQGTDALQIQLDYAKANDIELFVGLRVNDIHDVVHRPTAPDPLYSPFKQANPQYLTSWVEEKNALDYNAQMIGAWSSYDYTHEAVRNKFYGVVDELLTAYDVDGIFFDFHRDGTLFKSATLGQEVTDTERGYMTELFTDIRARAEAIGKQRGRPILVAVKLPDSVDYSKAIGVDLETWLDEKLVDLVIGGMHIDPYEDMVAFSHAKGAKYYASVEPDLIYTGKVPAATERNNSASHLANVSAALAAGVDGIQYFNLSSATSVKTLMVPDMESIKYVNKRYFPTPASNVSSYQDFWLVGGTEYSQKQPLLYPGSPVLVLPGMENELYVEVGDDIAAARAAGKLDDITVSVYGRVEQPEDMMAAIEGYPLTYRNSIGDVHYFAVPHEALKVGRNKITLSMNEQGAPGEHADTILAGNVHLSGENQFPWRRMLLSGTGSSEAIVDGTYRIIDGSTEGRPSVHYSLALPAGKAYSGVHPLVVNFSNRVESADDDQSVVLHITDGQYVSMVSLLTDRVKLAGAPAAYMMNTGEMSHYQLRITDEETTLLLRQGDHYQQILVAPHTEDRRIFSEDVMIPGTQNTVPGVNEHGLLFGSLSLEGESVAYWKDIQIVRPANSAWVNDLSVMVTYKQENEPRELVDSWKHETTNALMLSGGEWAYLNTNMAAEVDLKVESGTAQVIFSGGGWMTQHDILPELTVLSDGQVLPWDAHETHTRRIELDAGGARHFHSAGQSSVTGVDNVSAFLQAKGDAYTEEERTVIRNGGVVVKVSPGSVVTVGGIRTSISTGFLYKMPPTPEGLALFVDEATGFADAGWTQYTIPAGEKVYVVDSAGKPSNPLVELVPQPGQYLIYDASENSAVVLHQIRKDVGIGSGDWTLEMDMRIADLIQTSSASAADRWFGFVVEIFADGKRWRVNWSDDNQISLLGVASYLELPPGLSDDFHTYTLHYDGNGVLSVGVDGVLLGTLNSAGITAAVADGIQIISAHGQWAGGTTEVYLDHIGLYKFRENSLKTVAELSVAAVAGLPAIQVEKGIEKSDLPLPEHVDVTMGDGSSTQLPVTWDDGQPVYQLQSAGVYTFTGMLQLEGKMINPEELHAQVNVRVLPDTIILDDEEQTPERSNNAHLQLLEVWGNDESLVLSPQDIVTATEFSASTKAERVTVKVSAADAKAKIMYDGGTITTGQIDVDLVQGENSISIIVTAEDGSRKSYTLNITREAVDPDVEEPSEPNEPSEMFSDIAKHWANEMIVRALEMKIIDGYEDGTFRPDADVTRAEFIVMMMRALHMEETDASHSFSDADDIQAWAEQAIAAAYEAGIIEGYEDGRFRPDAAITRAEMATMIARALQLSTVASITGFADDAVIPVWAKGAVAVLKQAGIVDGRDHNRFVPDDNATRAEAVTILLRMIKEN